MYGPVLRGKRVTLRPPVPEDVPHIVRWLADVEVSRMLGYLQIAFSEAQETDWLKKLAENQNGVFWVIEVDGKPVGTSGIRDIDWKNQHGESGTLIGEREYWGKGIGTEQARLRTRFAFRELNLIKLKSAAFAENVASLRMSKRVGYREVGVERREVFAGGKWHDGVLLELLREDWERLQQEQEQE
ncbi:MAG TPA: GNAT family protein [Candidatus Dormibacteraeota bacterium]|nr:GNAT family protein [Candidatus Dormibacteraeota bacterium]